MDLMELMTDDEDDLDLRMSVGRPSRSCWQRALATVASVIQWPLLLPVRAINYLLPSVLQNKQARGQRRRVYVVEISEIRRMRSDSLLFRRSYFVEAGSTGTGMRHYFPDRANSARTQRTDVTTRSNTQELLPLELHGDATLKESPTPGNLDVDGTSVEEVEMEEEISSDSPQVLSDFQDANHVLHFQPPNVQTSEEIQFEVQVEANTTYIASVDASKECSDGDRINLSEQSPGTPTVDASKDDMIDSSVHAVPDQHDVQTIEDVSVDETSRVSNLELLPFVKAGVESMRSDSSNVPTYIEPMETDIHESARTVPPNQQNSMSVESDDVNNENVPTNVARNEKSGDSGVNVQGPNITPWELNIPLSGSEIPSSEPKTPPKQKRSQMMERLPQGSESSPPAKKIKTTAGQLAESSSLPSRNINQTQKTPQQRLRASSGRPKLKNTKILDAFLLPDRELTALDLFILEHQHGLTPEQIRFYNKPTVSHSECFDDSIISPCKESPNAPPPKSKFWTGEGQGKPKIDWGPMKIVNSGNSSPVSSTASLGSKSGSELVSDTGVRPLPSKRKLDYN